MTSVLIRREGTQTYGEENDMTIVAEIRVMQQQGKEC